MNTVPQPGTLLKLKTAPIIAHGAPDDQIYTDEVVMLLSVLPSSDLFVMHASGVAATIPCGNAEYGISIWFEVLS